MAVGLFIGGHSCGTRLEAGIVIQGRPQSMMAFATLNSSDRCYKYERTTAPWLDHQTHKKGRTGKVDDVNSQAQKERSGSVELAAHYLGSYTSIGGAVAVGERYLGP